MQAGQSKISALRAIGSVEDAFEVAKFKASEAAIDLSEATANHKRLISFQLASSQAASQAASQEAKRQELFAEWRASGDESVWQQAVSLSPRVSAWFAM